MPVIDEYGNIGYAEWECKMDYEWLGLSRDYVPQLIPIPPELMPKPEPEK